MNKPHLKLVYDKRYGRKWRCFGKTKWGSPLEGIGTSLREAYRDYKEQRANFL